MKIKIPKITRTSEDIKKELAEQEQILKVTGAIIECCMLETAQKLIELGALKPEKIKVYINGEEIKVREINDRKQRRG